MVKAFSRLQRHSPHPRHRSDLASSECGSRTLEVAASRRGVELHTLRQPRLSPLGRFRSAAALAGSRCIPRSQMGKQACLFRESIGGINGKQAEGRGDWDSHTPCDRGDSGPLPGRCRMAEPATLAVVLARIGARPCASSTCRSAPVGISATSAGCSYRQPRGLVFVRGYALDVGAAAHDGSVGHVGSGHWSLDGGCGRGTDAMLATLFKGMWAVCGQLIALTAVTFLTRFYAVWIGSKAEASQEA